MKKYYLSKDFYQNRSEMKPLIDKWEAEYKVSTIRDRLLILAGEQGMMRRYIPEEFPAWFCIENPPSMLLPWICRGCAEFVYWQVHGGNLHLYWEQNMVICGICNKNRRSLDDLRTFAAQKYARTQFDGRCTLCLNKAMTTRSCGEDYEYSAAALCRSCVKYWQIGITIEELTEKINFEALNRLHAAPHKACFICEKLKELSHRINKERICQACYSRYRARARIKMSITAIKLWHTASCKQGLFSGYCELCNQFDKLKIIATETICMQCCEDKYGVRDLEIQ